MEKFKSKRFVLGSAIHKCVIALASVLIWHLILPNLVDAEASERIQEIESFVKQQQERSKIPGLSVLIVEKGETVYQKGYGYSNAKTKEPVTPETLFEIGSASKAFTGLAVLKLEEEGMLKRTEDVRKYIPWLELQYQGETQTITLDQLMHHTSGIASTTIAQIPESQADNALQLTVGTLLNQPLDRKPGTSFEYATINYDVLGYVIETVTKQSFEQYVKQRILDPIGMEDTFVGLNQLQPKQTATGYKIGFMREQAYIPPIYRGNVPAGYIISNSNDIAKWLKLQLGSVSNSKIDKRLIQESHYPDLTVEPFDQDTYYAAG
ncbi:serine hydrolase domain-containing protein [Paenibacillus sp. M1]|uniref:Serine hydrolase domain-containing protein n=1 Tax=Paenibacillus haidiansis TaxID=1574488 RepID=A0ABU7VY59_9BACL